MRSKTQKNTRLSVTRGKKTKQNKILVIKSMILYDENKQKFLVLFFFKEAQILPKISISVSNIYKPRHMYYLGA